MRLAEFLSVGYKKGVRPVKDWNTPTNVEIDLMVYSILNVVSYTVYKAITIFCVLHIYFKEIIIKYTMCHNYAHMSMHKYTVIL